MVCMTLSGMYGAAPLSDSCSRAIFLFYSLGRKTLFLFKDNSINPFYVLSLFFIVLFFPVVMQSGSRVSE